MAALDWIFVVVLLASMLMGAWRGLVFEVLSLLGWVVSFFVAQWFAQDVAAMLPLGDASDALRYAAGFLVVFVGSVFACGFVTWLAKKLVESMGLRPVDRTLPASTAACSGRGFVRCLKSVWACACKRPVKEGIKRLDLIQD